MSKKILSALALAAFAGLAPAYGGIVPETAQYAGSITIDIRTGQVTAGSTRAGTTRYDNTATPATVATSSTNLSTIWGDECFTTGTGTLDEFSCSIYNSSSSATPMVSTGLSVGFNAMSGGVIGAAIGGFNGTVTFTSPLSPGFFTIVTFTGLSGLGTPINLSTTDVLVAQQLSSTVGSTRAGIACSSPVSIGSSPTTFYKNDPSSPPAGFYTFGATTPGDPMYKIVTIPASGSLALIGLGGLVAGRRRR